MGVCFKEQYKSPPFVNMGSGGFIPLVYVEPGFNWSPITLPDLHLVGQYPMQSKEYEKMLDYMSSLSKTGIKLGLENTRHPPRRLRGRRQNRSGRQWVRSIRPATRNSTARSP